MRYEIITLKNETYALIAVIVPVEVVVIGRISSVDYYSARSASVQSADKVEQRGFSATRMTENRYEFAFPELYRNSFQNVYDVIAGSEIFRYGFKS